MKIWWLSVSPLLPFLPWDGFPWMQAQWCNRNHIEDALLCQKPVLHHPLSPGHCTCCLPLPRQWQSRFEAAGWGRCKWWGGRRAGERGPGLLLGRGGLSPFFFLYLIIISFIIIIFLRWPLSPQPLLPHPLALHQPSQPDPDAMSSQVRICQKLPLFLRIIFTVGFVHLFRAHWRSSFLTPEVGSSASLLLWSGHSRGEIKGLGIQWFLNFLKVALKEQQDVVDKIFLVEATTTHKAVSTFNCDYCHISIYVPLYVKKHTKHICIYVSLPWRNT